MNRLKQSLAILSLMATVFLLQPPDYLAQKRSPSRPSVGKKDRVETFTEAAMEGDLATIKSLLAQGMNINAEPRWHKGWTALMAAATFGRHEIVNFLLSGGADVHVKLEDGRTTLYQAAQNGDRRIVEALIAAGVELNAKTVEGRTALIRAAWMGHGEAVKVLLAARADTGIRDKDGWSAQRFAASSGDVETIKAFLAAGAAPNAVDEKGETPLMWATWNRNNDAFQALLSAGADVNAKSKSGETALMWAAQQLDARKIKMLLSAGANVQARDARGWTVLMFAASNSHFRSLVGHDNEFMERLFMAGRTTDELIAAGVDVNARGADGKTALVLAVESGHGEIVKSLLAHGADAQQVARYGNRLITNYWDDAGKLSLKRVPLSRLLESLARR
jgi:ankyrin repeat protein